jgi:hypothetical protein
MSGPNTTDATFEEPAKVKDFWDRMKKIPQRYMYRDDDTNAYYGPFDTKEQAEEYGGNADIPRWTVLSMTHPDDIIAVIDANHKAFPA